MDGRGDPNGHGEPLAFGVLTYHEWVGEDAPDRPLKFRVGDLFFAKGMPERANLSREASRRLERQLRASLPETRGRRRVAIFSERDVERWRRMVRTFQS